MRCLLPVIVSALLISAQTSSVAAKCFVSLKAFGHEIQITEDEDKLVTNLVVDGRQMHADRFISIEEVTMIGDAGVIIGESSGGGNACDAAPFVLSLPAGEPARLDGPLETCYIVTYSISGNTITFEEPAVPPDSAGTVFVWKLDSGFRVLGHEPYSIEVDTKKGWAELRRRDVQHPGELLSYGEIASQINALLGTRRQEYEAIIQGNMGFSEFRGDTYVGHACAKPNCGHEEAFVIADLLNRRVYLAWKPYDKPVEISPKLADWRNLDKGALDQWVRNLAKP